LNSPELAFPPFSFHRHLTPEYAFSYFPAPPVSAPYGLSFFFFLLDRSFPKLCFRLSSVFVILTSSPHYPLFCGIFFIRLVVLCSVLVRFSKPRFPFSSTIGVLALSFFERNFSASTITGRRFHGWLGVSFDHRVPLVVPRVPPLVNKRRGSFVLDSSFLFLAHPNTGSRGRRFFSSIFFLVFHPCLRCSLVRSPRNSDMNIGDCRCLLLGFRENHSTRAKRAV